MLTFFKFCACYVFLIFQINQPKMFSMIISYSAQSWYQNHRNSLHILKVTPIGLFYSKCLSGVHNFNPGIYEVDIIYWFTGISSLEFAVSSDNILGIWDSSCTLCIAKVHSLVRLERLRCYDAFSKEISTLDTYHSNISCRGP